MVKKIAYGVFGLLLLKDIGGDMRYNTHKNQKRARGYKQVENKYIQKTKKNTCKDDTRVSKTYEFKNSKTPKCHGQYDGHHKM